MPLSRTPLALAACAVLFAVSAPRARCASFDSEFDEQKKPWSEIEARLPPYPAERDLIPFEASGATPHRFYIDAPSVSVGEDGVVRYTLVVRAAGGATNTTFEGIRCETGEQKLYALGHGGGKWVRARDPRWQKIERKDYNAQHSVLYADFFCAMRPGMATPAQIIDALRREGARLR